ncbi:MAG: hypothetical protein K6E85_04525 [Lachnospiraceae bacterium]|nr:hypothetical protein [Lachnospiraceae bacterium]
MRNIIKTDSLPKKAKHSCELYWYLNTKLHVPADIINFLLRAGIIYQSATNEIIFVNSKDGYYESIKIDNHESGQCIECKTCCDYESGEYTYCKNMSLCPHYTPKENRLFTAFFEYKS